MIIFPAIDLIEKKAVRLLKGDYNQKTVYSDDPLSVAYTFEQLGARAVHLVDLEGAKTGETPNIEVIKAIAENTKLFTEVGGGIRRMETVEKYLMSGVDRVILGTAAVNDPDFLQLAVKEYKDKIAVGADVKNGEVAVSGWLEGTGLYLSEFMEGLVKIGVKTVICTDIARDGAMKGTNLTLYRELSSLYGINITASGGISGIEDVIQLRRMNLYGAIIGKAYYEGAISLPQAIEVAK